MGYDLNALVYAWETERVVTLDTVNGQTLTGTIVEWSQGSDALVFDFGWSEDCPLRLGEITAVQYVTPPEN